MTNKEILKKIFIKINYAVGLSDLELEEDAEIFDDRDYYWIIFSHGFAKKLWGEEKLYLMAQYGLPVPESPAWKYHLQQMVLEEEPIKYLEKFI